MDEKEIKPTSIRIDAKLFERIKTDAEKDKRSISKQIEYMLDKYYELQKMLQ